MPPMPVQREETEKQGLEEEGLTESKGHAWVSPRAADDEDKVGCQRKVVGSQNSPGRKSRPPRMAARVRGVAVL